MNVLQVMDRYRKEVIQVSTSKNDIKVQYLYDKETDYQCKEASKHVKKSTVIETGHHQSS